MTAFAELLADPNAIRHWLMIAEPYDPAAGAVTTLYFSDHGFRSAPADTPANVYFPPRIKDGPTFQRSLVAGARLRGTPSVDAGMVRLVNGDMGAGPPSGGGGDGRTLDHLVGYAWRRRRVRLYMGGDGFALADYGLIFDGVSDGIEPSTGMITIRLRDKRYVLESPLTEETFAGDGGFEGGDDLKGRLKPDALGLVRNVAPVYVGLVGGLHTFCVSGYPCADVPGMRQNGASIDQVEADPGAGEYAVVRNASGTFAQLGGPSIEGVITADVHGLVDDDDTWLTTAADLVTVLATQRGGLAVAELDLDALGALVDANSATVGLWFDGSGGAPTLNAAMAELLGAIGAAHWFDRAGKLTAVRLEAPGTPTATFGPAAVLEPGPRPQAGAPRVWRVRLGYGRAWRVQSLAEIAPAATDAVRKFAVAERRWALAEDPAVLTADLDAEPLEVATALDDVEAAEEEAARLLALHKPDRRLVQVAVAAPAFAVDLGDAVTVVEPRLGMAAGFTGIVIALTEDAAAMRLTLTLWG